MMQTLEQQRASMTWKLLKERWNEPDGWAQSKSDLPEYLGALRRTPARIHTSGLGQALAFLKSRAGKGQNKSAYEDLTTALHQMLGSPEPRSDFLNLLMASDQGFLFRATDEAVAIVTWMVRYLTGAGVKPEEENVETSDEGEDESSSEHPATSVSAPDAAEAGSDADSKR